MQSSALQTLAASVLRGSATSRGPDLSVILETLSRKTFLSSTIWDSHFGNALTTPFRNFSRAGVFCDRRHADFRTEAITLIKNRRQIETANGTLCSHAR